MLFLLYRVVIVITTIKLERTVLEVSKRNASPYFWSLQETFFQLVFCLSFFGIRLTKALIHLIYHEVLSLFACQ